LENIQPVVEDGRVRVKPPQGIAEEGCAIWENTLVGYFLGQRLAYPAVNSIAQRLWGKLGLEEVLSSDNGFYFFKLKSEENLGIVLDRASWHMANRLLVLKRWHPNLSLLKEEMQKITLWVKLFGVPLEYWTAQGLSHLASAVGKPLYTDSMTASRRRISYARVCVEVDAAKNWIKEFYLLTENGKWMTVFVEYDWIPSICSSCKVFGHSSAACPKLSKQSDPAPPEKSAKADQEGEWVRIRRKGKGKVSEGDGEANKEDFGAKFPKGQAGLDQAADAMDAIPPKEGLTNTALPSEGEQLSGLSSED